MKEKINYRAIIVYYIIVISCRYLTNKTSLLEWIDNDYIRLILTGVGPALGAVFVFLFFKIKPLMSLRGNYRNIFIPLSLYWALPVAILHWYLILQRERFLTGL